MKNDIKIMNKLNLRDKNSIVFKIRKFIDNSSSIITARIISEEFNIEKNKATRYLQDLERDGYITKKGKGEYISYLQSKLRPEIDDDVKKINEILKEKLPYLELVIWSYFNLKKFYMNIPLKNFIFIEARANYELETIRATLLEENIESILNPKNLEELFYRKEIPIILIIKRTKVGTIDIDKVMTPTIERMIIDLYSFITRKNLLISMEDLGEILINAIKTGEFNFTFVDRYIRWRNVELDFLMIFSTLSQKFPKIIPERYNKRYNTIKNNVNSLIGGVLM